MKKEKTFMGKDGCHLPNEIVDYQFWWRLVRVGIKRTKLMDKWSVGGKRWEYFDYSRYEGWDLQKKNFLKVKFKDWWSGDRWRDLFAVSIQTEVLQEVIINEKTGEEKDQFNVKMEFVYEGDKKKTIAQFEKFIKELSVVDDLTDMDKDVRPSSNKRQIKVAINNFPITPQNTQIKYYGMLGIVTLQECKMKIIYGHKWGKDERRFTEYGVTKIITPKQIWELFLKRTSDKVGKNIPYHTAHKNHKGMSKDEVWEKVKGTVRKNLSRGDKLLNNVCRGEFTGKYS
jgi:hypothetical protein